MTDIGSVAHVQAVTRLAFRPGRAGEGRQGEGVELASCSDDRSVRVWIIVLS